MTDPAPTGRRFDLLCRVEVRLRFLEEFLRDRAEAEQDEQLYGAREVARDCRRDARRVAEDA